MPRRHGGWRLAGHRPPFRDQHSPACHFRARHHEVGGDARRHLLRLAIRWIDHVDPDADSGRGLFGHDLHRRLRHGAERPRRRCPVHSRGGLMDCGHLRSSHADADCTAARGICPALRAAGIRRTIGTRVDPARLHVVDLAGAHARHGMRGAPPRHHRHRQHDGAFPLLLRYCRARRRDRYRPRRRRPVRTGRDPLHAVSHRGARCHSAALARAPSQPGGMATIRNADRARLGAWFFDRIDARIGAYHFELPLLRGGAPALEASRGIRQGRGCRRCRSGIRQQRRLDRGVCSHARARSSHRSDHCRALGCAHDPRGLARPHAGQ